MKQDDRIIDPAQEIWVAGHNDVGYSPDPDNVTAFATQGHARDYIADEIERVADGLDAVAWDTDEPDELANGAHADAELVRHDPDQDYREEFSVHVEDGRALPTSFWVQRSTLGERFELTADDLATWPERLDKDEEFQSLLDELPETTMERLGYAPGETVQASPQGIPYPAPEYDDLLDIAARGHSDALGDALTPAAPDAVGRWQARMEQAEQAVQTRYLAR